jgi:hypothetical protein
MSLEPEQAADQEGLDLREKSQMPQLDLENQTGVENSEQKGGSHMEENQIVDAEFTSQNESDLHLPGMEPVTVPQITAKALEYAAARDTRIKYLAEEIKLKEDLIDLMHGHGLSRYQEGDLLVTIQATEKVKVKIKSAEEEGGEED